MPPSATQVARRSLGDAHAPLRDKVAEAIRAAILAGRFRPGERLIEDRLADEFGVSRNPIREAIRTLASEGLVEVTARRGAMVAVLSPDEADELLEVRATLEAANARLAARRRDAAILAEIKDILRRGTDAIEAGRLGEIPSLNREFHATLARAGHNRVLADLVNMLRDRTGPLFRRLDVEFARETWLEHATILRAVIDGDPELASMLAYRHVRHAGALQTEQPPSADAAKSEAA